MLSVFKSCNINLTKIDSRPILNQMWNYHFFVEIEGHYQNPNVTKALDELRLKCQRVKVLESENKQKNKKTKKQKNQKNKKTK